MEDKILFYALDLRNVSRLVKTKIKTCAMPDGQYWVFKDKVWEEVTFKAFLVSTFAFCYSSIKEHITTVLGVSRIKSGSWF